ncbi:transient receptor potential cation channel protein painless-like [Drosophila nasuta]|uniref:transient receptor potential cation channel protein painless-like n=1 Tax=Drosophila nasuta TaxID=42062 RepID=UPI00295EB674|nr:transient receptor potential cation channel protein painless-like [Drosophila nasuta]
MGFRSDYETLPIKNINPDTLKEHLDSCIQMDDKNVIMDFSNISQPPNETNLNFQHSYDDMSTIYYIRKSKNLRHLLNHPIVSTFLFHKWQTFSKFFYFQIFGYVMFITSLITMDATGTEISMACVGIICYVLLFRDVAPLWLDISLGGMSGLYIISDEPKIHIQTFVLLLACLKLFSYMIMLPVAWMAKPFGMLFAVINTVIESGILILVVVTFGVCFHIEFGNSTETTNATDT